MTSKSSEVAGDAVPRTPEPPLPCFVNEATKEVTHRGGCGECLQESAELVAARKILHSLWGRYQSGEEYCQPIKDEFGKLQFALYNLASVTAHKEADNKRLWLENAELRAEKVADEQKLADKEAEIAQLTKEKEILRRERDQADDDSRVDRAELNAVEADVERLRKAHDRMHQRLREAGDHLECEICAALGERKI